jgi:hypothetical protein
VSDRRNRRGDPAGAVPAERVEAAGERRIRYTLDLSREQHRFLKRFAFDAETDASVVMRALLALLQNDEKLARRVLSDLER